jgi:hypothetical protein
MINRIVINYRRQISILLIWTLLVVLYLLNYDLKELLIIQFFILIISIINSIRKESYFILSLPFFALLSPIFGIIDFFSLKVVLCDIYIFIYFIYLVCFKPLNQVIINKNFTNKNIFALRFLVGLFVVSSSVSLITGITSSIKSFSSLLFFVAIYLSLINIKNANAYLINVINSWFFAMILGGILLFFSYLNGNQLSGFESNSSVTLETTSLKSIFRASYFYTGFHFVIGVFITFFLIRLLVIKDNILKNIFISTCLFFLFLLLFLMLNKTAIMASFISVLILVAYYSIRLKTISVISNLFIFIIFSAIAFTYINANFFTFHYDTSLLFDEGFSTDSFAIRVSVYSNALINFFKDPIVFLFGLGPTALETGTSGVVDIFKTDSSGLVQGTVDSTYVSYLVEMGVFSFIIIIYLLVAILDRILKLKIDSTNKTASITSLFISSSIIYFLISFFTQSLGYSKISWLFFIISFYVLNSSENSRLSQDDLVGIKENSI